MRTREELHEILCSVLRNRNCYFSAPSVLKYPCMICKLSNIRSNFANDKRYLTGHMYEITIIDENPDSKIHQRLEKIPYVSFVRFYTADNLNHWVYNLYFK